ncbi:MAG TPA: response regulator [Candidatus Binatia bacterium]|nr:response regulator [Candidatus Binatia bacterium]
MKTILIVEDDPRTTLALAVRLKAQGYSTWTASDGIKGMQLAMRARPDLIILDIGLPGGNGFELAATLRRKPQTSRIPIIFLTGSKEPTLRQKVMDSGAAGLLEKPYEPEELLLMIQMAFDPPGGPGRDGLPISVSTDRLSNPKRILIVEDDERIARALAVRLTAAGYETSMAHDGLAGFRAAVLEKPDLVLLDISLAAGDGFTVAERIQNNIPRPIPMIFLTASKRPEFRQKAQGLGAVGFFEKPFEASALLRAVNKAVHQFASPNPG